MLTVLGAGHWLGHTELQISVFKNVQHSWTPFPFRTASQGTLSTRLLKRLKSAIQKVKWKGGRSVDPSLYFSKNRKLYHCMITVPRMASNHHFTHQSFSVHKHQIQWMSPSSAVSGVIFHTFQESPGLFPLLCCT